MTALFPPFPALKSRGQRRFGRRSPSVSRVPRYDVRLPTLRGSSPVPSKKSAPVLAHAFTQLREGTPTAELKQLRDELSVGLRPQEGVGTITAPSQETTVRDNPVRTDGVARVMIIEADREHRHGMVVALHSCYDVEDYADGRLALDRAYTNPPDLILIDEHAIGGGLELVQDLVGDPHLSRIPFICTAGMVETGFSDMAQALGACAVLRKPFRVGTFVQTVSSTLNRQIEASWDHFEPIQRMALQRSLRVFNEIADTLTDPRELHYSRVMQGCTPLVEAVSNSHFNEVLSGVRDYDNYTYAHSLRVATFIAIFGHGIGLRDDDLKTITSGGLLHDVGKIGIPRKVLNKPSKLTEQEWDVMRSHVPRSVRILRGAINVPHGALVVAEQHHEKLDGSGYPYGLKGKEINTLARIAAICDVFGALTDRRIYKAAMAAEEALKIMGTMRGALDPYLLKLFREMLLDMADQL